MNYCDKCGGPLRTLVDYYGDPQTECRLCDLDHMAWRAIETRSGAWMRSRRTYMTHEEAANSTANTTATSRWLPDGARLPVTVMASTDEMALKFWLREANERAFRVHEFWGSDEALEDQSRNISLW